MQGVRCVPLISALLQVEDTTYLTQHIATAKHRSNAERKDSNQSILQFVSSKSNDYDTIRAETLWTLYVVEHNMPFTSSDSFSDIAKVMFPERHKFTVIIKNGTPILIRNKYPPFPSRLNIPSRLISSRYLLGQG